MSARDDMLKRVVDAQSSSVHPTSYNDVREGYIKEYGDKKWIAHYLSDLGYRDASKKAKEDKVYQNARRAIERYGAGSKYANAENREKAGRNLEPVSRTSNHISVTVTADQGRRRGRKITANFTGENARKFANNPTFWEVWYQYAKDAGDEDPSGLADIFEYGSPDDDTSGQMGVTSVA